MSVITRLTSTYHLKTYFMFIIHLSAHKASLESKSALDLILKIIFSYCNSVMYAKKKTKSRCI